MRAGIKATITVLFVLLLVSTASAVAVPGQSTTPTQSLPYNLNLTTNITPPDTVVIAVADPNDYNVISLADVVANHIKAPVLITPPDRLDQAVIETITQMLAYGSLSKAVVVGTDNNTTTIAGLIADITDPLTHKNIEVTNIIYATSPELLSIKTTTYEWSSASAIIVTDGYVQADVSKALLMSAIDNIPVIYEQAGVSAIAATANLLGATTIYVTPAVDPDTINGLQNAGLTVNDTWHNVTTITDAPEVFATNAQPYKNATFVVVKENDLTPYDTFIAAMGIYSLSNSTVIIADNSTTLGTNQTSFLTSESPAMIVLVGNITIASETLSNSIAATTGKVPWRLVYDNPIEKYIELALAGSNYYYPVVVPYYTQVNDTFTYQFKNLGFSDVIKFDKYSLRATFIKQSGTFENSVPAPVAQNETLVVYEFDDPIYPHDSLILTFSVTPGTSFNTTPDLTYYSYTAAGTVKPLQSFFGYIVSYFSTAKAWITEMFNNLVGVLSVYLPLPNFAVMFIAGLITFLILWALVGVVAYVIKRYGFKHAVTHTVWYGPIIWLIGGER